MKNDFIGLMKNVSYIVLQLDLVQFFLNKLPLSYFQQLINKIDDLLLQGTRKC